MSNRRRNSMAALLAHQDEDKHGNLWLITYADMITLVLAFFVMLAAVSDFNPAKFEEATQSAKKALGSKDVKEEKKGVKVLSIEELINAVNRIIRQKHLEKQVEVTATGRGVVISAKGAAFFTSGAATILPIGRPLLQALASPINHVKYSIAVEGHTDNIPSGGQYPSNWELSSARASEIVRYLINSGVKPNRLRAVGLADTQPKRPNTTETNRSRNRRIEIVFLTAP